MLPPWILAHHVSLSCIPSCPLPAARSFFSTIAALVEVEACRAQPDQMLQTISVDVGDASAVEKAMGEAVAQQGAVQARE